MPSYSSLWVINFYPRPPRGGRPAHGGTAPAGSDFYPRPPRGGRPNSSCCRICVVRISIHALREEGDQPRLLPFLALCYFYPRPPRGGRPDGRDLPQHEQRISIHALREEGDFFRHQSRCNCLISIHALREEGDYSSGINRVATVLFLSTPSARRATAKTETKSLFSNKLYNILHEFRRALIYNGSKNYPNHAK